MKILFVSDFSLAHNAGGAQVSNDLIIKEGIKRGHKITEFNFDTSSIKLIERYDLVINSNLEFIYTKRPYIFHWIMQQPKTIRFEHDSCQYFHPEDRKKIFGKSKINLFLSEHHLEYFKRDYGNHFHNAAIVLDPIDTDVFYSTKEERTIDTLYCGFIHTLKGYINLINYARKNPEEKIEVYGWGDEIAIKKLNAETNIEFKGKVSHEEIPNLFRKTKKVFHSPIVEEPFCRMVAEAILCGCEIVGNLEKIGSWLEHKRLGAEEFKNRCQFATEEFWKKIESCYQ